MPTFEPHASAVSYGDSIVIKSGSTNANAKVYYTIDGSAPTNHETENCHLYSGPIEITKRTTIKAISCIDTNCFYAEVSSKEYAFGTIEIPRIASSQDEVFYSSHNVITISCDTEGVEIRYTLDGEEPTDKSNLYTGPFTIDDTTTVKAKAFKADWFESETATATFTREWYTVETPVIESDETTFENVSQTVYLSCVTEGTMILYTTDGSNPKTNGSEYKNPLTIYDSCTIRAIAVKYDWKDSEEISAAFTRAEGLSESVNLYGYLMETDTSNPWTVVTDVSHDGVSCARSGVIGHGGMTWLQTSMRKAGTVSFWWKAACEEAEEEDGETYWYDYGVFLVDGVEKAKIAGNDTGWRKVEVEVSSGGKHILRWEYRKDGATSYSPDCIWLDQVQWIPADDSGYTLTTPEPVPYSWLRGYNLGLDSDFETAAKSLNGKNTSGKAMSVWQDYVAGTDPTNVNSVFTAAIEMVDGLPHVTWSPDLNTNGEVRVYTVFGKTNLTDAAWVCPTNAAHRFFKVKVEMP
ncbi:MAG: chitobiase/beta-hexosaminidase C-terminal domain-containing protein [Kiritimatiellae bacterium]|nr:chitobiase/beta-hexosaminidase C-terminal domain-containing protein [Kiritimatiellia bacterium]